MSTNDVRIPGQWVFEPASIRVVVGENVTWTNDGRAVHSVTFEDVSFDVDLAAGESASFAFPETGVYAYVCKYHPPDMRGSVTVVAPAATSNETA